MTAKRAAILQVLQDSTGHLTAEEIFLRARELCPGIVLATVYNNLNALAEAGVIRRIKTDTGADYFDRTPMEHDHALCTACGALFDLPQIELAAFLSQKTDAPILSYHLVVHSICPACQKSKA